MSSGFSDTTAVLVATAAAADGGPAAALGWDEQTLLRRLLEQLAELGVGSARVLTRPRFEGALRASTEGLPIPVELVASPAVSDDFRVIADAARAAGGPLVVAQADVVTQREVLAGLLADPRIATGVLASAGEPEDPFTYGIRSNRVHVVSAASPYHRVERPRSSFLGVVKVAPGGREQLAAVAERLGTLTNGALPEAWRQELSRKSAESPGDDAALRRAAAPEDATALLVAGLVRDGMQLAHSWLRELFWARPLSPAAVDQARAAISAHDEERALLDSAVKPIDGFFTTFFVSPYSKYIARWCARHGLTPNHVTSFSLFLGLLAAAGFATGQRWGQIAGAVLLQAAFTTDCVDGQLARYTRSFSKFGAWLDSIFDRTKEYLVFGGLAIGAGAAGDPVWVLAAAALTLQTSRHAMDFSYGATERTAPPAAARRPLEEADDGLRAAVVDDPGSARRFLGFWRRLDRLPGVLWVKRIVAFPIGERFLVISLTAAIWSPRVTFIVLLAWGGLAVAYSLPGRLLRALSR